MKNRRSAWLALLLTVPIPSIGTALGMVIFPGTRGGQAAFFLCKVWLLLVPLVWRLAVDGRHLSWSAPRRGGFRVAAVLGVAMSLVVLGAYAGLGRRLIDGAGVRAMAVEVGLASVPVYVAGAAYWILVNSVLEEYVWRWFVFHKLEVLLPDRLAIPAAAVGFTLHHVLALRLYFGWDVTALASLGVFTGGVVWGWCYRRYRSIWPGYASHAIVDVTVFVLGYLLIFR